MFDVRCLENPFWVPELRELTGLDEAVRAYIFNNPASVGFTRQILELLLTQAELAEGRSREVLNVAIGCTGGQHRSVAVAEFLAAALQEHGHRVELCHRELEKL